MDAVTGVILAGGRSSRMGQDKALASLAGQTFLRRISNVLFPEVCQLLVIAPSPLYLTEVTAIPPIACPCARANSPAPGDLGHLPSSSTTSSHDRCSEPPIIQLPDDIPNRGPLGGLKTALRHGQTPWYLAIACDMPLMTRSVVRSLLLRIRQDRDIDAVVPVFDGHPEPLCAVYHQRCLATIEGHIHDHRLKMVDFFSDVRVDFVPADELWVHEADRWSLFNVNTPDDLAQAERILVR